MYYKIIALALLIASCGLFQERNKRKPTISPTQALQAKYELYTELHLGQRDENGWILPEDCDSILFSSLAASAINMPFDIELAEEVPGKFVRNPVDENGLEDCFNGNRSRSETSRDMYLGVMFYAYTFERLDILERIYSYGQDVNWVMGDGKNNGLGTVFTPDYQGLLARLIVALGGPEHPEAAIPYIPTAPEPGFTAHLHAIYLYLHGESLGGLTQAELATIEAAKSDSPENPLFHAILGAYDRGEQQEATRLLLDIWPDERLPTSQDWCEEWRIQRQDGDKGFEPCDEEKTHSGGAFLFVADLILDE